MDNSLDLVIEEIRIEEGRISDTQFEAIADYALRVRQKYEVIRPDEESLKEAKEARASLNKLFDNLEAERKRVKKLWNKPYADWEARYYKAIDPVKEVLAKISSDVTLIEARQRDERIAEVQKKIDDEIKGFSSQVARFVEQFPAVKGRLIKNEYYNKTFSEIKRDTEVREALKDIHATITGNSDDPELLAIYAEVGNLAEAINIRRERRLRAEKVAKVSQSRPAEAAKPAEEASDTYDIRIPMKITLTDADRKNAVAKRSFTGEKYKILAVLDFAEKLGLKVEKI